MTAIPESREAITTESHAALAVNRQQALYLHDPSPEIDSAIEHLIAAHPGLTGDARRHVRAALNKLVEAHRLNTRERDHHLAICEQAARIGRQDWSYKGIAQTVRDQLAIIANPVITGDSVDRARRDVLAMISEAPRDMLLLGDSIHPRLVHELRARKSTTLLRLIREADGMAR